MTTTIPSSIETTANQPNTLSDATVMATTHARHHNNISDSVIALSKAVVGTAAYNATGYGATGDGITDDTIAVAAAIAAAAISGGVVNFPAGTFLVTKLTLATKVILRGAGAESTVIKLKASANTALITTTGFSTADAAAGVYACGIEDLTLDGNKANQASNSDSGCLQIYGYNFFLNRVKIRNGKTVGLYTNWGSSTSAPGPNGISMEASLNDVEVFGSGSDGIYWNGPHDSYWHGVISHENAAKGINIGARGNALKATGCHSWGSSQTYAWYIEGAALQAVNCEAEGASSKQVYIDVNDVSWIGGQVYAAGGATTGFEMANSTSGYNLVTKVLNCTTAAIAMTSDGGGKADLVVYGTSGSTFTGTVHADTRLSILATGGQVPLAGQKKLLGPWYVANAGSPFTDQYFQINGGASGASVHEIAMMRSGSITGIIIRTSENRTAGTFTADVQKNGSKIGLSAVLDGANVTFKATTQAQGAAKFVTGDVISVVWTTVGWTPTTADITCTVEIDDG